MEYELISIVADTNSDNLVIDEVRWGKLSCGVFSTVLSLKNMFMRKHIYCPWYDLWLHISSFVRKYTIFPCLLYLKNLIDNPYWFFCTIIEMVLGMYISNILPQDVTECTLNKQMRIEKEV